MILPPFSVQDVDPDHHTLYGHYHTIKSAFTALDYALEAHPGHDFRVLSDGKPVPRPR